MKSSDPEAPTMAATSRPDLIELAGRDPLPPPPEIPDYELIKRIGRGSYGEVWMARNVLGTYYAIKIVYRQSFESDRPFDREFEGIQHFEPISRLHESQVTILHVGRKADCFYYVMELADDADAEGRRQSAESKGAESEQVRKWERVRDLGSPAYALSPATYTPRTLRSELNHRGRLSFEECLQIALKLTEALGHLHQHGLVHRDIKPSNVIFVNGRPKLADIGLVTGAQAALSFVGTEGYLPIEGPGQPPADIYSLGKVIYEISTGLDRNEYPELPSAWKSNEEREGFAELNEVILKACAADLEKRYSDTEQMHQDLLLIQAGKSIRRSRAIERRLAIISKASLGGIALTALLAAGYFYQQSQTRLTRQLGRESELKVAQLHEEKGLRLMEEGDLIGSLPWFTEALTRAQGDVEAERRHRFRIGEILRQCPRLLQIIHEPGRVAAAEFSPDARRIITTGETTNGEQYLSEWSFPEGRLLQRIDTGLACTRVDAMMALSPNGKRVVVWTRNQKPHEARVYDLDTGKLIGQPLVHGAGIRSAQFSEDDGQILTTSDDGTARLWNSDSGEGVRTFTSEANVLFAAMTGDRILTTCENGMVYLWDVRTGEVLHTLDLGPKGREASCPPVFSPDGHRVMIPARDEVQVWDVRTGIKLNTLPVKGGMESLRLSPDGEMVLAALDKAQIWDAATGEPITPPLDKSLTYWTTALFSPDSGRVISGSDGGVATVWDARTGGDLWPPLEANSPLSWFGNGVRFSPDGRTALVVSRTVHVWDMTGSNSDLPTIRHQGALETISFSPDGRWLVTASEDHTARVWDAQTALPVSPPLRHEGFVVQAQFTSDGARVLTTSYDGAAQLWDARTGEKVSPALKHGGPLWKAEVSRDGKWILTVGQDNRVRLWNSANGQPAGDAIQHGSGVNDAAFISDGRTVITVGGNQARAWDVPTGARIPWQPQNRNYVGLKFSPGGRGCLTLLGSGGAQVLDSETFEPVTPRLSHFDKLVMSGCWSTDLTKVVTAGDEQAARLWDSVTGKQLVPPMVHPTAVANTVFSSDGRWILTIGGHSGSAFDNDSAYLWDANTGLLAAPPLKNSSPIRAAALSPDGRRLFIGGTDGMARAWDLSAYEGSVEDLKGIVEVLSGRRVVGTTIVEPVEPEKLSQAFERLRDRFPQYFARSTNSILSWHRREALDRARSRQKFAAHWHTDRVKELEGDTAGFRDWRKQVLSRGYLARDPATPAQAIDLTDFYTAPLTGRRLWKAKNGWVLHDIAPLLATRTVAQVDFDIRGIVHLNGTGPGLRPLGYPKSVREIRIQRTARRLHFLQATTGETSSGTKIGTYVVHYENGQREEVPMIYGENVSNYQGTSRNLQHAELAWEDPRDPPPETERARVFKFTWDNPHPTQAIRSIDFNSTMSDAAPFLVALTVE